jgi:molecular chaperone GrpE
MTSMHPQSAHEPGTPGQSAGENPESTTPGPESPEQPPETAEATDTESIADTPSPSDNDTGESAPETSDTDPQRAIEHLREQLAEAERREQENHEQWLRAQAELQNVRRRASIDTENAARTAVERFVNEFLPVVDSLEFGLAAAQQESVDAERLREGTELTLKKVEQLLEKFEIQSVNPQGERFDPERHQAMTTQPTDEVEPNTVVHVMQKGYLLKDRLVRPALVVVSKAPDAS